MIQIIIEFELTDSENCVLKHYSDVIMGAMASQTPASALLNQPFIQAQIKENIKALRNWPLCGEFTGDRRITLTNGL